MTTTDSSTPVIYSDPKRMTDEEIVTIIREHAGVNPEENVKRDRLLEIAQEQGLRVDGETKAAKSAKAKAVEGKKPVAYVIEIPSTKTQRQVTGGVNGKSFIIQCDVKVTISAAIMEALKNAKKIIVEQTRNADGTIETRNRETPAVPVYVHETIFG